MDKDRELYTFEEAQESRGGAVLVTLMVLSFMFFSGMGAGYLLFKIILN